jgi:hypothetical protein
MNTIEKVTLPMNLNAMKAGVRRAALALLLVSAVGNAAAQQRTFPTPEAAVDAFAAALQANDEAQIVALFGSRHRDLVGTGDPAYDASLRARAAADIAKFRALDERGADRRVLLMGPQAHPFAIPLVREGGTWRFATEQGVDELINRRIGANERYAIYVMRTYVGAQRQYASADRDGDGVLQYARSLMSSPGKRDGLYWPADTSKGEEPSPFGPLIAGSTYDPASRKRGEPYRGYHYRILSAQGKNAPGGAYSYVINGRMIAGFAMVAYPDDYGNTGVMTFIVSHNGKVYEKDLGSQTESLVRKMTSFDPGTGWREVSP